MDDCPNSQVDCFGLDSRDEQYSIQDIVKVLGTCRPRYSTFPLVGINEALRDRNVKTQLLWCELPQVSLAIVIQQ